MTMKFQSEFHSYLVLIYYEIHSKLKLRGGSLGVAGTKKSRAEPPRL